MSRSLNKILDFMRLNDDEYDDEIDDYEDDMEEEPVKKRTVKKSSAPSRRAASARIDDDFDDFDDIDDDIPASRKSSRDMTSKKNGISGTFGRSSKVVPLHSVASRSMEVCVSKPVDFNTCQEISDIIISGRAAIINFDAVTTQEAQRIIDFVSGSCYAINGSAKQISDSIVIVTPKDIDITGDLQEMASSDMDIPAFGYSQEDE